MLKAFFNMELTKSKAKIVEELVKIKIKEKFINKVTKLVCDSLKVDFDAVFETTRKRSITDCRAVICSILSENRVTRYEMSDYFGLNHSTITHAVKMADSKIKNKTMEIKKVFYGKSN